MINIILYFSIGLILLGYCYYIYLYITYNNTKITDDNGFLIIKYEFSSRLCKKTIQGIDIFCK